MHKVYENDDLMMYFKKRYCHCCGKVLQKKRTERIVYKGDPDHREYCSIGTSYNPHGDILVIGKEYFCSSCNKSFSCDEQGDIIEAQKYYQRNIVTKEEINNVKNQRLITAIDQILKMRWLLLIPVIGGTICTFIIFSSCLREKIKHKDLHKLTLSSLLVFMGIAEAIKLMLSIINNEMLVEFQKLFMLVPSLLSVNIPVLLYINKTFKKHKNSNNAYCSNCGSQLEERVQKVDLSDYDAEMQYFWDTPLFRISFPIVLPTHTESRVFTCHKCKSEFSFEEQLIYKELQKKCEKNKLFTKDEIINQTINSCVKKINKKNLFLFIISTSIVLIALALTILILTNDYISPFFISIPFLLFFFFDILNNNRRDNLLKKKCFLMISKNQTNLKEFINFEYEKVELKKRITSLLTFLIIPASSTILFMCKSCCKSEYNFTFAIISVITWIFFFVGLRRVIKLVTFIKEKRNN